MTSSRRHLILQAIEDKFKTIEKGVPEANPYTVQYGTVTRMPVDKIAAKQRAACGLYPMTEDKKPTASEVMNVTLDCVLELHINREVGDQLADLLEMALSEAERRLMEDQNLKTADYPGGLCIDINVYRSEISIDGYFSNVGSASLKFLVMFRHSRNDPAEDV